MIRRILFVIREEYATKMRFVLSLLHPHPPPLSDFLPEKFRPVRGQQRTRVLTEHWTASSNRRELEVAHKSPNLLPLQPMRSRATARRRMKMKRSLRMRRTMFSRATPNPNLTLPGSGARAMVVATHQIFTLLIMTTACSPLLVCLSVPPTPHLLLTGSVLGHTSFAENLPSTATATETTVSTPRTEQAVGGLTNPADIRQGIMSTIQEISEEMENSIPSIASGALDFIHAGECVLVLGQSYTIQHFLAIAAKKIKFQVRDRRGGSLRRENRVTHHASLLVDRSSSQQRDRQ
jgi:hypothetical protein